MKNESATPMPTFLVIGTPRAGTSTFYHWLAEHREIYMSKEKELHFFSFEGGMPALHGKPRRNIVKWWNSRPTTLHAYRQYFRNVESEKAIGEVSPSYLGDPRAPGRILHHLPSVKLIAILRDPVRRAYSHFCHNRHIGLEPARTLAEAIREELDGSRKNWDLGWQYIRMGQYSEQLMRYLNLFNYNQVKIILFEDLIENPITVIQDTYRFLEVDSQFIPNISRIATKTTYIVDGLLEKKIGGVIRKAVRNYYNLYSPLNPITPALDPETRQQLNTLFEEEVSKLRKLLQRELSTWCN